ncbi:MAG: tyrosine--tRNA ligase [Bacilli bacterium]
MNILDELRWRGLIYDIINEEELHERLKNPITLYCGFDPTADSMHIGSLLPIITLMRFHRAGHRVIALTGSATGLIGDPSGKKTQRQMNPVEIVAEWSSRFDKQFARFLPFDGKTAFSVNNYSWLGNMGAIEMWRDYGKHFNLNYMLAKESVKSRLESGLSYLEFSYMIMQSIDFLKMYQDKNLHCEMQIGGQDQWGNITAGMELIRKVEGSETTVFGLTLPLITKSDGTKFGKTESGAIWLDEEKTSPYEMYQFFINTADSDVIQFLKYYTFLNQEDITYLEEQVRIAPHLRKAQKVLASEVVRLVHKEEGLEKAVTLTEALFKGDIQKLNIDDIRMCFKDVASMETSEDLGLVNALILVKAASSKREARQFIQNGAVSVNGNVEKDLDFIVSSANAIGGEISVIRRGKKNYYLLKHQV